MSAYLAGLLGGATYFAALAAGHRIIAWVAAYRVAHAPEPPMIKVERREPGE